MTRKYCSKETGQGLVEYALVIALIALAAIIVLSVFGSQLQNAYANVLTMFHIDAGGSSQSDDSSSSEGCQQGNNSTWITGFDLIDATNDVVVGPLNNGATVNLSNYGSVSIVANAGGNVAHVVFSGTFSATENIAPYSLGGDNGGDYDPVPISPGQVTFRATPQDSSFTDGTACEITVTFT